MSWIVWSVFSALFAAATAILGKSGVSGIDSNLATAIRSSAIFVFVWVVALATRTQFPTAPLGVQAYGSLILSGIAGGLSWLCYFRALQLGEASRVAPVDKLSAVFVILFASLFLGESLTLTKASGGLLIVAGAILLALE